MATNASSTADTASLRQFAPVAPAPRPVVKPLRIDSGRDINSLSLKIRNQLGVVLYDIFCESYGELDRDTVCDEIVFRPGGTLYLIRDAADTIVGFGILAFDPVTVQGRTSTVLHGGVYCRRDVRGAGDMWTRHAARAILREKAKHPLRPLYYMCEALTPISYRCMVRSFPTTFPSRRNHTSPRLAALLSALIDSNGVDRAGDHPFVIRYPDPASHKNLEQMPLKSSLRDDPDVQYYLRQNPDFADGNILCAIIPFGWSDLLQTVSHQFLTRFRKG